MSRRGARDEDCRHDRRFRSYPDDGSDSYCTLCEVKRLREQRDECRRLLREAVEAARSDDPDDPEEWYAALLEDEWFERAEKAGGGDEPQ
jgi:hypothetical protein